MKEKGKYNFSFTAGTLMVAQMHILATEYLRVKNWDEVQGECGKGTLLTYRTLATCKRFGSVLISRLKEFSPQELDYFLQADAEEEKLLCWVAVCRCHAFIREFMVEVVREHYLCGNMEITYADYASFFNNKAQFHPELESLTELTRGKMRQMVFKIMTEAGIIENRTHIVPTIMPPHLLAMLPREDYLCFPMFVRED